MRKYFIFLFMLSALLASSCKDLLNTAPYNEIASENMWTTESLADNGVAGLYYNFYVGGTPSSSNASLGSSDIEGICRQSWMGLEFQSSWYTDNLNILTDATKRADRTALTYEWKWCYTGIHRINDAIENLGRAPLSTDKYERYMCEVKFLRAWYYSRLNEIFQGVPLYLEVVSNEQCTKGQSTSTEIWEAVISDLTDCVENEYFPDNTLTTNYGRPSKGAAYSLRGKAYMWLAWENGEDNTYYQLAADDFEKVSGCGYGLWEGAYIDFFHYNNETSKEMIFPIQYTEDVPYTDFLECIFSPRDVYYGTNYVRPSSDFVDYFQNADGSKFNWEDVIPEWNDAVFTSNPAKREVFFLRDSISLDESNKVVQDYWTEIQAGTIQERINEIGADVFNDYYKVDGNEDRIRSAYNNRDPRLKDIVLTPYDPYDTYHVDYNDGEDAIGKELRWPFLKDNKRDGNDIYIGNYQNTYIYKKYVYNHRGDLKDYFHCPTDWPLIRYTDVYLRLAECYVHLGKLSDAVSIVNEIRARAEMPSVSVGSSDEVMEAVRYERRVELCAEGHDWFDEWRWGTYKEMKFQGNDKYGEQQLWGKTNDTFVHTWYYTDDMYPWGAPTSECQRNSNLKPKDGWVY